MDSQPDGIYRYTPTLSGDILVRAVTFDRALSPHLADAITSLTLASTWLEVGDSVHDIIDAASVTVEDYYQNMLIGSVSPWLSTPPDGWLLLDGTTHAQADYPELAAVLDDSLKSGENFTLPDVGDAFPFGVQVKANAGAVTGSNTLNLTVGQLPEHTHTYTPPVLTVDAETPTVPIPTAGIGSPIATGPTGDGDDIDRRPLRFGLIFAVYAGRT